MQELSGVAYHMDLDEGIGPSSLNFVLLFFEQATCTNQEVGAGGGCKFMLCSRYHRHRPRHQHQHQLEI